MSGGDDGEGYHGANGVVRVALPSDPAGSLAPNQPISSLAVEPPAELGLTAIGPVPAERTIRAHALVLQSMSIWHVTRRTQFGWILLVRDADATRAAEGIDRYEHENRDWPPPRRRERPRHEASIFTPLVFAGLLAFFLITGPAAQGSRFFDRGTAVSDLLLFHQPWRAITALTLHADSVHILGNAVSGTIFGAAVNRRIGAGGGMLAILASGILGNVANAVWHHAQGDGGHASIGASTAIFGAIGILAATQVAVDRPPRDKPRSILDIAAPIIGGFALLGALGSGGANTDLGAHFFGLVSGCIFGLIAALILRPRKAPEATYSVVAGQTTLREHVALGSGAPNPYLQLSAGLTALAIVVVAWSFALRH